MRAVSSPTTERKVNAVGGRTRNLERRIAATGGVLLPTDATQVPIDASTSGDNIVVAGVTSKRIQVVNAVLIASDIVTVRWYSDSASGTELVGPTYLLQAVGYSMGIACWMVTDAGEDLVINLDANVQVGGMLAYRVIT